MCNRKENFEKVFFLACADFLMKKSHGPRLLSRFVWFYYTIKEIDRSKYDVAHAIV